MLERLARSTRDLLNALALAAVTERNTGFRSLLTPEVGGSGYRDSDTRLEAWAFFIHAVDDRVLSGRPAMCVRLPRRVGTLAARATENTVRRAAHHVITVPHRDSLGTGRTRCDA